MRKRGAVSITMEVIVMIVLISLTFIGIAFLVDKGVESASDPAAETACFVTNALKVGVFTEFVRKIGASPQGCRAIDKGELGVGWDDKPKKEEIAGMVEKCWYMWLGGYHNDLGQGVDVIDKDLLPGKRCFACYLFTLPKGTEIQANELSTFLALNPVKFRDKSDGCNPKGGYCKESCSNLAVNGVPVKATGVQSSSCPPLTQCCVPNDQRDECVIRGGRCDVPNANPIIPFAIEDAGIVWIKSNWLCQSNQWCYVPKENVQTTLDYVQGGGNGPGALAFTQQIKSEQKLVPGKQYVVAFNEDMNLAQAAGLIAGGAGALVGGKIGLLIASGVSAVAPALIANPVGLTVTAGLVAVGAIYGYEKGSWVGDLWQKDGKDFDMIVIGTKDELITSCGLEYGVAKKS